MRIMKPNGLDARVRRAGSWQEHQRLQFEVIHNQDTSLLKSLLATYRENLAKEPTPLLRWAYANCSSEILEHNIGSFSPYAIKRGDYLSEEQVIEQHKQLIKKFPTQVLGYLGLARAYKAGFFDVELLPYEKIITDKYETVVINGRKQQTRVIHAKNPEQLRRYRQYRERILQMEPNNPFVYYWDALSQLRKRAPDLNKAIEVAVKAYQLGMNELHPIDCLAVIVYSAWRANRREEAEKYAKELRRWAALAPNSAYVRAARERWQVCPLIKNIPR